MLEGHYSVLCPGIGKVTWTDPSSHQIVEELVRPRLTVDPSLSKKDTDALGLALVGWGRDGTRFIIASWRVQGGVSYASEKIASVIQHYGVYDMGVEVNGLGNILKKTFEQELYRQKLDRVIVRSLFSKGGKEARIESQLQRKARDGEIYVLTHENKEFLQEYELFPDSPQKDVLDAVGMGIAMNEKSINGMPFVAHPTELDVMREVRPKESFWEIPPDKRQEWLEQRMGTREGYIPAMDGKIANILPREAYGA
jgi:hypothetical protein